MEKHSNAFCPRCGSEKNYNYQYDAYYCELCNAWLDAKCEDVNCKYCSNRPTDPSKANND